jgi:cyclophilin family peptidyl-prolyl cis-trans isomerase
MPNRALLRPFALALVLLPLLIACGGGSDKSATPSNQPPSFITPTTAAGNANSGVVPPASDGTCGPEGSGIAGIPRRGIRSFSSPPSQVIDPAKTYIATMETVKGIIVLQLDPVSAPITVNNFVFLSCDGFYDGLTFWRVEPGFVIQGGDPNGNGSGGPGYKFQSEVKLKHDSAGVLSMANSGHNTNGSQFFITLAPAPHLDTGQVGFFNAFGHVTEGMDVVQTIAKGDKILSISIEEK